MEVVTGRLLHAEKKTREKDLSDKQAMTATRGCGPKCFNCEKFGHIQRHCPDHSKSRKESSKSHESKSKSNDSVGLLAQHVLGTA